MKPEKQQIAIAEALGIDTELKTDICKCGDRRKSFTHYTEHSFNPMDDEPLADYLNNLNAICDAAKTLDYEHLRMYHEWLYRLCGGWRKAVDATASQRAEAFLRTIGKWEES